MSNAALNKQKPPLFTAGAAVIQRVGGAVGVLVSIHAPARGATNPKTLRGMRRLAEGN
jgi:hypothetical protein